MRVAKNQRAPGADVIEVLAGVNIVEVGALRAVDYERRAADGAECADGTVHTADEGVLAALEKLGGARAGVRGRGFVGILHCAASH